MNYFWLNINSRIEDFSEGENDDNSTKVWTINLNDLLEEQIKLFENSKKKSLHDFINI